MASIDVTIRGGGIFGLSIAWVCAGRGARVRVVDPHGPGAGASGGIVGALAPHVPENWNEKKAFQLESLLMAGPFWQAVDAASGLASGYGRTGRLQPIADDARLTHARTRGQNAEMLWQGRADWRVIPAGPAFAPRSPSGWLIKDTLTARLHPAQAIRSLAAALLAMDVPIVTDAPDVGQVLHATGIADLARLNTAHSRAVGNPIKGQAAVLGFDARDLPQIFADAVHIIPHADGTTAIGSTTERDFDKPTSTDARLDTLIVKARAAVPALQNAPVLQRWAGLRPRTRSRAPMLGPHPLHPGHFIANGGFRIGFGMAPGVAHTMADLLLDGTDTIPDSFRPEASY